MQTLVAYAYAGPPGDAEGCRERVRAGSDRVQQWYGPLWGCSPRLDQTAPGTVGLLVWTDPGEPCRWPAWSQAGARTVATLHVPLGSDRLGLSTDEPTPLALTAHLRVRPADVHRLAPPFVLAELDARSSPALFLFTDGLGLGRLHEVRTAEGTFWSNRPVAALRFAGLRAEPDPEAWQRMAACDWAMGDRTPYRGVRAVPAATRITADASGVSRTSLDVLEQLIGARPDPLTPASVDLAAAALEAVTSSVSATWPGTPVLSLSGGRDSRLVAAAFLAAGRPVRLRTYGTDAGEVETARRLVGLLSTPVEHEVTVPAGQRVRGPGVDGQGLDGQGAGAFERARRWHDMTEGLRPAVYLRSTPPRRLLRHHRPLVSGVGGEFGHAPGYPDDIERLEPLPLARRLDAYTRALHAKVTLPRGVAPHALAATERQIRAVVDHAAVRGATDAKALDWFYADERLRRWGLAGESSGRVLPLLVGEFVSAALRLSTAQSRDSALHSALIDRLVPAWAAVPFYSATLRQRQAAPRRRLWQECDAGDLEELVLGDAGWGEAFDVPRVRAIWRRARAGRAAPRDELLLQRVVWRAAFTEHLAALDPGTAPRARVVLRGSPAVPTEPATPAGRVRSPVVALATWANDIPTFRRLARTGLGRRLRGLLGV